MFYQDQIRDTLARLDLSTEVLCAVVGISATKLSRFMKDVTPLSGAELQHLMRIVSELRELADEVAPYRLAFQNPQQVRGWLGLWRAGIRPVPQIIPDTEVETDTAK